MKIDSLTGSDCLQPDTENKQKKLKDFAAQLTVFLPVEQIENGKIAAIRLFNKKTKRQDFLSLSLSPPLTRRRNMLALRGQFVSL